MANLNSKNRVKWIVAFSLIIVLIAGFIGMAVALNRQLRTYVVSSLSYEVGGINEETGEETDSTASIRMSGFFKADGLNVNVKRSAEVTYRVYFYGEDQDYISVTELQSNDFNGSIPEGAEYIKIVIIPTDDEEISLMEVVGYANQLTVTVKK